LLIRIFIAFVAALAGSGAWADTVAPLTPELSTQQREIAELGESLGQDVVKYGNVTGLAIAIVHGDQVLLEKGFGTTRVRNGDPVRADTVFRLASVSKGFAATAAGLLVDDGLLAWHAPVTEFLPAFRLRGAEAAGKATVADLLGHSLGLPRNAFDRELEANQPYPVLATRLEKLPAKCGVGECYGYQNIAYSLIGDISFAVTGEFFHRTVEKRIFHPLGMTGATFGEGALASSVAWARPHVRRGRGWVETPVKGNYYRVAPAAGVNASVRDLVPWMQAQMGGRLDVIPQTVLDELHAARIHTPTETESAPWRRERLRDAHYGMGWRIYDYAGEKMVFHAGAVQGYRAMMALLPEQEFGIVVLWNCESGVPGGVVPTVVDNFLGLPAVDWLGRSAWKPRRKATRLR
jgi:beta-lactamase class C